MTTQDKSIEEYQVCIGDNPARPRREDCQSSLDQELRKVIEDTVVSSIPEMIERAARRIIAPMIAEALTSPEVQEVLRQRYGLRPRPFGP